MKQKKKLNNNKEESTVTIEFDINCPVCGHTWLHEATDVERIRLKDEEFLNPRMACPMCRFIFPVTMTYV